jgi:hypothetical protein
MGNKRRTGKHHGLIYARDSLGHDIAGSQYNRESNVYYELANCQV